MNNIIKLLNINGSTGAAQRSTRLASSSPSSSSTLTTRQSHLPSPSSPSQPATLNTSHRNPSILLLSTLIPETDDNKENEYSNIPSPLPSGNINLKDSSDLFRAHLTAVTDTRLCIGVSIIPHPAKRDKGGEDAYFVSEDLKVLGVADGVGGWGDLGVDPALYSRMLMAGAKYIADSSSYDRDPQEIMEESYNHASDVQGSSTCCIAVLEGTLLKTANLGDSGFLVVRDNAIVFRSKEQQHSFNFPYQLGTGSSDRPAHASCTLLGVAPGDLIIMGTDGLFDNLYDDEILGIVKMSAEPATVAQLLARRAFVVGNSKTIVSPFARAARDNGYPLATGGKLDDITVLVARVVLNEDPMAA